MSGLEAGLKSVNQKRQRLAPHVLLCPGLEEPFGSFTPEIMVCCFLDRPKFALLVDFNLKSSKQKTAYAFW